MKLFFTKRQLLALGTSLLMAGSLLAETQVSQELELGYQKKDVNVNEAKFEEYREVPDGAFLQKYKLGIEAEKVDVDLQLNRLRQQDQSFDLSVSRHRRVKLDLSWDQIPHLYSNDVRTAYTQVSPGVFRLGPTTQASLAALTGNTTSFLNTYRSMAVHSEAQALGFRSDTAKVGLALALTDSLKVRIGASQELKHGSKARGAPFGFGHVVELPEPIDYRIYTSNVDALYTDPTVQFGVHYTMSAFNNDIDTLIWDNAQRTTDRAVSTSGYSTADQTSQGLMSLAPSNVAHNFNVGGGVNLPYRSRLTADISVNHMSQNDLLPPYTINTAIRPGAAGSPPFDASDPANLPEDRANAKMLLWTQNYGINNNLWSPLTLGFRYRTEQLNNQTAEISFPGQVVFDQNWSAAAGSVNKRFQYRKELIEGQANWQVLQPLALGLRFGQEKIDREHREVKETKEDSLTLTTDVTPSQWLLVRGSFLNAKRMTEDFEIEDYEDSTGALTELPGLRRFDLSSRERNIGKLLIQASPDPVTVALSGSLMHDNFSGGKGDLTGGVATNLANLYGLLERRQSEGNLDLGWDIRENLSLSSYYDFTQDEAFQRQNTNATGAISQDTPNDWILRTMERFHTVGLGFEVRKIKDRAHLKLNYDLTQAIGSYDIVVLGSALQNRVNPVNTETIKQDYSVKSEIEINSNFSIELGYLFEKYNVRDFEYQNIDYAAGYVAAQKNFFLGDNLRDYDAHVGTLMAKVKW